MSEQTTPPVMRGDLFSLLDPDPTERSLTPGRVSMAAKQLVEKVTLGHRAPGTAAVMGCLGDLVRLADLSQSEALGFGALKTIRQRLVSLGGERSKGLPWPQVRKRSVVLPQRRSARLVRALSTTDGYFALTCEASPSTRSEEDWEFPDGTGQTDGLLGDVAVPPVDVTYRLFRFGESPSDIRMVMRIVQEAGTFKRALLAGDGERVALLSRDVIGIFDPAGKPVISGRVPLDKSVEAGAEVTAMALAGDILALNIRPARDKPVEMAILNVAERKGLPVGVVGEEAAPMALGTRQAYVIDGLNLLRVPLFAPPGEGIAVFRLRPWFAEYAFAPEKMVAFSNGRVWVTNGHKIIVMSEDLSAVLAEVVLPEPIVDFDVHDNELSLVFFDADLAVARIESFDVG